MGANRLKRLYELAGYTDYAERVSLCAMWFKFGILNRKRHVLEAKFCKLRLCPICIARGALVRGRQLSKVMNVVQDEHKCQYIFLTLTVQNVKGDKLGEELSHLTESWNRLLQHGAVKRAVKGWFRALEITRHGEYYHPHIHAIIAVEDGYFKRKNKLYISHDEWVRRWQMALHVDYKPSVRISKTTGNKGGEGAVLEAAKYAAKSSDYIDPKLTDEEAAKIVADYTEALYHRRLTAYGGWLKEVAKRFKAGDLDNVDLIGGEEGKIREDMVEMIEEYGWHFGAGDYVLARRYVNPLRVKREESDSDGSERKDDQLGADL